MPGFVGCEAGLEQPAVRAAGPFAMPQGRLADTVHQGGREAHGQMDRVAVTEPSPSTPSIVVSSLLSAASVRELGCRACDRQ